MLSSVSFFIFWDVCVKWTENIEKDSQILLAKMEVTPAKEVCSPVLVTVLLVRVQRVSTAIFKNLSIVCACISAAGVGDLLKADGIMNTEMYSDFDPSLFLKTTSRNYRKSCLREFRPCSRIKLAIPNVAG